MDDNNMQKTFLSMYSEHSDALFRFCLVKVRNRDLAVDIVQDTFTRTWEYLVTGKEIQNIRAFMYRVARNLIVDHSRRHESLSLESILEEGFEFQDKQSNTIQIDAQVREAIELFDKLPTKYRDVLYMRHVDNLEISDIALALGETPNVISVRLHRALKKLQILNL